MRAIIFILILAIVVVIAAVATGFLNINQIRGGQGARRSVPPAMASPPRAGRRRPSTSRPGR